MSMEKAINDSLDYMGSRVVIATALGGSIGGGLAIYRGHSIPKIAGSMAQTWAMTATACVVTQQLALAGIRTVWPETTAKATTPQIQSDITTSYTTDIDIRDKAMILASHGVGGIGGGSVLGYLYIRKPLRGIVFMAPVMLMVGLAEIQFQERKRQPTPEPVKPTRNIDGSLADHLMPPEPSQSEAPPSKN